MKLQYAYICPQCDEIIDRLTWRKNSCPSCANSMTVPLSVWLCVAQPSLRGGSGETVNTNIVKY